MKEPVKQPLKNLIQEHYLQKSLNQNQLDRLQNLSSPKQKRWLWPTLSSAAVAAIFVFFLNLAGLISFDRSPIEERIAKEVIYNHLKKMPSEVLSADYARITEALDRLDFEVIPSQVLAQGFQLIGARYCSIQGAIAAQLKLKSKEDEKVYTLYQGMATEEMSHLQQAFAAQDRGAEVRIWREKDRIFALAVDLEK